MIVGQYCRYNYRYSPNGITYGAVGRVIEVDLKDTTLPYLLAFPDNVTEWAEAEEAEAITDPVEIALVELAW